MNRAVCKKKKAWIPRVCRREDAPIDEIMRCGRKTVSVFGGICDGQLLPLYFINGSFDRFQYCDVLENLYWPVLQEKFGDSPFRYILDGAPAHKAAIVRDWAESEAPQLATAIWQLPAYSPDLNVIEHVWARMKSRLSGKVFTTREELVQAVQLAWDTVAEERTVLHRLCDSMPRRLNEVIRKEGDMTRY